MHVLLSGAAGFIGSHLADRLLARGDRVTGIDNFDPFYPRAEKVGNLRRASAAKGFELLEVDITDPAALRGAVASRTFDVVVHLAAKAGVRPSIENPTAYVQTNVLGTQCLLEVARERGVPRFVFASSSSVYGNTASVPFTEDDSATAAISPYAATKRSGELLCATHQVLYHGSMMCLRFFTVYGPRQRPDLAIRKFASLMAAGKPIQLFGDGGTERDYTWIDDIIEGTLSAVDRTAMVEDEFQIINLGGSRTTTLRRLVELVAAALGVTPTIERLPPQPGDVVRTCANVSKARALLGYEPRTSIEEGIPRFIAWLLSNGRSARCVSPPLSSSAAT